ncbi:MAG: hypothetical protein Q9208_007315 [Pyrenodesmia sp. 3 TL-2023]
MAELTAQQASTTAKPSQKRPLFTKPSWATEDKSGNATDFFRRSNQSYVNIAAEAERKRQRKLARKEKERAGAESYEEPAEKRRRISGDSDSENDSDHSSSDDGVNLTKRDIMRKSPPLAKAPVKKEEQCQFLAQPKGSPISLSKRYETEFAAKKPLPSNIIDLEDEDDAPKEDQDEEMEVTAVKRAEPPPEDDDDFPLSDDEFAELARKAREKARRKRLEADVFSTNCELPSSGRPDDRFGGPVAAQEQAPPPAAPDPVVSILITSRIANTNPLIVNRKVSQRLKDVRVTWCQRQGFSPEFTATVFMTWRGKRLFDVTTCRSLGIGVDFNGNIVMKGQKDILGEEERQIHMEAMTEEILEETKRQKRREADGEGQGEVEAQEDQPAAPEQKEPQVRIILKAKGYSDFKLIVKPATKVSRIVSAFRSDKKIDHDREVFLSFDGDRLVEESQVGATELADMDYVDVYVK